MNKKNDVVRIIGGGMTGLTLALKLACTGQKVIVHEQDPYLGGLTSESTLGGIPIERFYHCILPTDFSLLQLIDDLGLTEHIGWNRTRTGFFTDGKLMEMTTVKDFLRFPALTLFDRIRLGWTIAYCGLNRSWQRLDNEPIGPFLIRHSGKRLFESIWEPLLLAKLGPQYNRFAASFIWATVYRMLSARKAKGRSEKLGFVRGRYGKVFIALRKKIESLGGEVIVGKAVKGISRANKSADSRWLVHTDEQDFPAQGNVLCVPTHLATKWLSDSIDESLKSLYEVEYLGVICEVMLLKSPLTPYYVLNLTDRTMPFTGVIETSNLTGREEYFGHSLVYLPRYRNQNSELWNKSDSYIHQESMDGIRKINPTFCEEDIVAWSVNRARYVQPIHPVGWGNRIPPVRLAPGLAYVSTAQIHPWTVFNDKAIENVDARFAEVMAILQINE
jgi:protoporphyrinogen oxidase